MVGTATPSQMHLRKCAVPRLREIPPSGTPRISALCKLPATVFDRASAFCFGAENQTAHKQASTPRRRKGRRAVRVLSWTVALWPWEGGKKRLRQGHPAEAHLVLLRGGPFATSFAASLIADRRCFGSGSWLGVQLGLASQHAASCLLNCDLGSINQPTPLDPDFFDPTLHL